MRRRSSWRGPAESAATAEADFYEAGRMRLRAAGMRQDAGRRCRGLNLCRVRGCSRPSLMRLSEVKERAQGGALADEATLFLDGPDIRLRR